MTSCHLVANMTLTGLKYEIGEAGECARLWRCNDACFTAAGGGNNDPRENTPELQKLPASVHHNPLRSD